jgi:hypothetical protein
LSLGETCPDADDEDGSDDEDDVEEDNNAEGKDDACGGGRLTTESLFCNFAWLASNRKAFTLVHIYGFF